MQSSIDVQIQTILHTLNVGDSGKIESMKTAFANSITTAARVRIVQLLIQFTEYVFFRRSCILFVVWSRFLCRCAVLACVN